MPDTHNEWEKSFNELFTENSHEPTLIRIRHFIRTLLGERETSLRKEWVEKIKEFGHQQDNDEIWCNMDDVLAIIEPDSSN